MLQKKRLLTTVLASAMLAAGLAAPAAAAENTPPVIHVPSEPRAWPDTSVLPWRAGVTATDAEDGDISDKLVRASHIIYRSDRPGDPDSIRYQLVSVTDSHGATTTERVYFDVIPHQEWRTDNKPPVLVAGGGPVTICLGETYDPLDHVRFDDDYDGKNIGMQVFPPDYHPHDGKIYPGISAPFSETTWDLGSFVGTLDERYRFSDSDGGLTPWITITVTVKDCGAPKPEPANPAPARGFFLNDGWGSQANKVYSYGRSSDEVYVGDWNGDGKDTIALRRGSTFHINNGHDSKTDTTITYGRPGDTILVGDWDGNGTDTFAVRRGKVYHVKNSMSGGPADRVIAYGREADQVLVGDWNGDGRDTFAVRRGREYHVKNTVAGGKADKVVAYGRPADDVYVGDWDGDGKDTFTVRRGATYYVANAIRGGDADRVLTYGRTSDVTLVGDWNGDGIDTLGVRR